MKSLTKHSTARAQIFTCNILLQIHHMLFRKVLLAQVLDVFIEGAIGLDGFQEGFDLLHTHLPETHETLQSTYVASPEGKWR